MNPFSKLKSDFSQMFKPKKPVTPAVPNFATPTPTSMTGNGQIGPLSPAPMLGPVKPTTPIIPQVKPTSSSGLKYDANVATQQQSLNTQYSNTGGTPLINPPGAEYDRNTGLKIGGGTSQGDQGGDSTPAIPNITPAGQKAVDDANKAYQDSLKISPEELSTQGDLDRLIESTKKGYQAINDKTIPMEFITGQLASVEQRALNLAEPLESKLARLQATRISSLESSKFALDRADKALALEKSASEKLKLEEAKANELKSGTSFYDPVTGTFKQAPSTIAKPASAQEYEYAKSQGYKGSFIQYQNEDANRKAKASGVGANDIPVAPLTSEQQKDPFLRSLIATKGGSKLTDTSIQKLDKGLTVLGQIGVLQSNIQGTKTGPLVGAFRGANPWDTNAQTIKASLNAIVPNLARGVFGEVGVLTDNDIKNYSKTIPTLSSTEAIRNAVLYITLDMIGKSIKNTLQVNASAKRDVSGFVDIYAEMENTKNSILSTIPGAQVPSAFKNQSSNAPDQNWLSTYNYDADIKAAREAIENGADTNVVKQRLLTKYKTVNL